MPNRIILPLFVVLFSLALPLVIGELFLRMMPVSETLLAQPVSDEAPVFRFADAEQAVGIILGAVPDN